ncbi:hypothetical protein BOTBODRAFT_147082 [Botryobasidium botryosum FD-172 SS1]|uniref:1-phosphatidylinositol 4-kinase n=1 Tax=Botryobasidium botryosum (strain FD-172 SS1) TaxID=930990 RepID=A0A067M808_BOTB1|nr:hypothetical protein BOTBODRAFT_147082 [Botryobasidium botryosum FD-172 SS1]
MDSLDFNLHQLILHDLAQSVASSKDEDSSLDQADPLKAINAITTRVETRAVAEELEIEEMEREEEATRVFMSATRIRCNIAFGELATNLPESHVDDSVAVLMDILRDIPYIDFDPNLAWTDWALPDQLTYSTVSALLGLATSHTQHRDKILQSILDFASHTVKRLQYQPPATVITEVGPSFHGFYRAMVSTSFPWSLGEWSRLFHCLAALFASDLVDRLNGLLTDYVHLVEQGDGSNDPPGFVQSVLSRYFHNGRPLTGYFSVCSVIEIQATVLAQVLCPPQQSLDSESKPSEAAAANNAWKSLSTSPAGPLEPPSGEMATSLRLTLQSAMECFTDLLTQIEEMGGEPSLDTYAWETMAESLKLASLCSIALQELDPHLLSRLKLLLSESSPVLESLVQEAALKATTVLVQNFQDIAAAMANHLRRFAATPLPIFEFEFASKGRTPPPLVAVAKCLALCIKLAPGDDLIMSHMYSLLNYIAATSKDSGSGSGFVGTSPYMHNSESTIHSPSEAGMHGYTEEQKTLVGISTISVVTRLAMEFQQEEVIQLTVSMLLQRLAFAEPAVEAAIAYNLVDLALCAPAAALSDIFKAFNAANGRTPPNENANGNNLVLAAQTRLAQELHRRPDLFEVYLCELLTLFSEKGVALQRNAMVRADYNPDPDFIEELSALVLPIDALLAHREFNPQSNASPELVALFRNMWFICVLFHCTSVDPSKSVNDWQAAALARIASKTPPLVAEEIHDYVSSELEYNPVLRKDYVEKAVLYHRNQLTKYIPARAGDIRYLSPPQVILLLTLHDVESMRTSMSMPSSLVWYFTNDGLNKTVPLPVCMDAVAEKVMRGCVSELSRKIVDHSLEPRLSEELRILLISSCHRITRVREVASRYLNLLVTAFPSLMCDAPFVFAILDVLTMLRRACEGEFVDEFNPEHEFHSERTQITLRLTDSYAVRNEMLAQLYKNANEWLSLAITRAPIEVQATLQRYLSDHQSIAMPEVVELGASLAVRYVTTLGPLERKIAPTSGANSLKPDLSKLFTSQFTAKAHFAGEAGGLRLLAGKEVEQIHRLPPSLPASGEIHALKAKMTKAVEEIRNKTSTLTVQDLKRLLFRCASVLISTPKRDLELLHYLVNLPFEPFSPSSIISGIEAWTWLIQERPDMEIPLMVEINYAWSTTIDLNKGLFSQSLNTTDPFIQPIEYSPMEKKNIDRALASARRLLLPHTALLQMLTSRFQAVRYKDLGLMTLLHRLISRSTGAHEKMSTHPAAREARFALLMLGFEALRSSRVDSTCELRLRDGLFAAAFSWFAIRPQWSFGPNYVQIQSDIKLLKEFLEAIQNDATRADHTITSMSTAQASRRSQEATAPYQSHGLLLRLLVENEISHLSVWRNPTNDPKRGVDFVPGIERALLPDAWAQIIRTAWKVNVAIAIHMVERFKYPVVLQEVTRLIRLHPEEAMAIPEALTYFLADKLETRGPLPWNLRYLLLWAPVPPVQAVTYFGTRYENDPIILQYAHRTLEQHPVELTFFFVPQVVQALRTDKLGYVEQFIFETAKISQLFCHQIIWNMKANCYKDDAAEEEDPMKPMLDRLTERVVASLSGEARDFYNREFDFFGEVTSISGKLKPFIKRTKAEKKAKIDEEMGKIKVEVGVYLPSNPDGRVIDIDKKSGRPLQSHAKAPFMATFKVRKERLDITIDPDSILDGPNSNSGATLTEYDVWQQAIFKVGDDCRQDVLALQIIAMFKNVFAAIGLTLYLNPYRVTATAPGCGVIDVVPNSTSRDEMGRAKVNDLMGFFVAKYGNPDTIAFQKARLNFIQSMAAYSVACYILQIKDRHNGNIMIDGEGHIVHIDFGFLFDIGPGGVKFEPNSFKLNHEMVVLMGGKYSEGYALFVHLTVKAFLSIRPHAEQMIDCVQLMLGTGLPSFKGEGTIKRLRDRFVLGMGDREAAEWMMSVIKNAHENVFSTVYDEFQRDEPWADDRSSAFSYKMVRN